LCLSSFGCIPNAQKKQSNLTLERNINSCLESLSKNNLNQALLICNKVIEKSPTNIELLAERSLIYTLTGQNDLACLDIENALKIMEEQDIDPLTKYQIRIRYDSCRKR